MSSKWLMKQQEELEKNTFQTLEQVEAEIDARAEATLQELAKPTDPLRTYTWVIGDNIWQVAQRLDCDPLELLEHNDIEDYTAIAPGTVLHLIKPLPIKPPKEIHYDVFPETQTMHVVQEGGTHKLMFANHESWSTINPTGMLYAHGRNVKVDAIAYVPIGDDTAAFYMDKLALGDYETTGLPTWSMGFNSAHLAEGEMPVTPPAAKPEVKKVIAELEKKIAEDALALGQPKPKVDKTVYTSPIKATWQAFRDDNSEVRFEFIEDTLVKELDGRGTGDKYIGKGSIVSMTGSFGRNGEWGRPSNTSLWYCVPMSKVRPVDDIDDEDDEVYNTDIDLPTRAATGRSYQLTTREKWVTIPSMKLANYFLKVRAWIKNKKQGEK